jgi:hypothetical protein
MIIWFKVIWGVGQEDTSALATSFWLNDIHWFVVCGFVCESLLELSKF